MNSQELYNGYGWKLTLQEVTLPDGRRKSMVRAHRPDSAHILAFTDNGALLLLKEFRPYYNQHIWMLPSGRIDKESEMLVGAMRELREETGYRAGSLTYLYTTHHTESLAFANHIFLARKLTKDPLPQDDDEMIEVFELPPEEALTRLLESPIVHTPSAYALLRYLRENGR